MTIKYSRMSSNFIKEHIQKVLGVQKSQIYTENNMVKKIERMRKKKIYISIYYHWLENIY